jgi:hypothetical protein
MLAMSTLLYRRYEAPRHSFLQPEALIWTYKFPLTLQCGGFGRYWSFNLNKIVTSSPDLQCGEVGW